MWAKQESVRNKGLCGILTAEQVSLFETKYRILVTETTFEETWSDVVNILSRDQHMVRVLETSQRLCRELKADFADDVCMGKMADILSANLPELETGLLAFSKHVRNLTKASRNEEVARLLTEARLSADTWQLPRARLAELCQNVLALSKMPLTGESFSALATQLDQLGQTCDREIHRRSEKRKGHRSRTDVPVVEESEEANIKPALKPWSTLTRAERVPRTHEQDMHRAHMPFNYLASASPKDTIKKTSMFISPVKVYKWRTMPNVAGFVTTTSTKLYELKFDLLITHGVLVFKLANQKKDQPQNTTLEELHEASQDLLRAMEKEWEKDIYMSGLIPVLLDHLRHWKDICMRLVEHGTPLLVQITHATLVDHSNVMRTILDLLDHAGQEYSDAYYVWEELEQLRNILNPPKNKHKLEEVSHEKTADSDDEYDDDFDDNDLKEFLSEESEDDLDVSDPEVKQDKSTAKQEETTPATMTTETQLTENMSSLQVRRSVDVIPEELLLDRQSNRQHKFTEWQQCQRIVEADAAYELNFDQIELIEHKYNIYKSEEVFLKGLCAVDEFMRKKRVLRILSVDEYQLIFGKLKQIQDISENFFIDLSDLWERDYMLTEIAEVIKTNAEQFFPVYITYRNSHPQMVECLRSLQSNATFMNIAAQLKQEIACDLEQILTLPLGKLSSLQLQLWEVEGVAERNSGWRECECQRLREAIEAVEKLLAAENSTGTAPKGKSKDQGAAKAESSTSSPKERPKPPDKPVGLARKPNVEEIKAREVLRKNEEAVGETHRTKVRKSPEVQVRSGDGPGHVKSPTIPQVPEKRSNKTDGNPGKHKEGERGSAEMLRERKDDASASQKRKKRGKRAQTRKEPVLREVHPYKKEDMLNRISYFGDLKVWKVMPEVTNTCNVDQMLRGDIKVCEEKFNILKEEAAFVGGLETLKTHFARNILMLNLLRSEEFEFIFAWRKKTTETSGIFLKALDELYQKDPTMFGIFKVLHYQMKRSDWFAHLHKFLTQSQVRIERYNGCRRENPAFSMMVQNLEKHMLAKGQTLVHYLTLPEQHATRLLWRVKNTYKLLPPDDPELEHLPPFLKELQEVTGTEL